MNIALMDNMDVFFNNSLHRCERFFYEGRGTAARAMKNMGVARLWQRHEQHTKVDGGKHKEDDQIQIQDCRIGGSK